MRCRQASELVSSHIDGELSPERDRALKAHLEGCPRCAGEVVALRDLRRRLHSWDEAENRLSPSRSFRRRVLDAVRAEPARAPSAPRPALRWLRGEGASSLLVVAGSLAAAVLLIATGLLWSAGDSDTPPSIRTVDDLTRRADALDPSDVEGRLDLARRYELEGDPGGARGQYLRVLAVEPTNPTARAALGFDSSRTGPRPYSPTDRDLRARLEGIPTDVRHPDLARVLDRPETVSDDDRIGFEGHEIARGAVRDFEDILEGDRQADEERERRGESVARGPSPEKRRPYGLTGVPGEIAAYVARLEPVMPTAPNRFDDLVVLPILDPRGGRASGVRVITAQRALRSRLLSVIEEKPGRVVATNLSDDASVFIPAGTILAGRSQDRVTGRDVLVRAGVSTTLPTFCCEEGRTARAASFTTISGIAGPGLRRLILRERDQKLIWARIRNQTGNLRATSSTHTLRTIFENSRVQTALAAGQKRLLPLLEDTRVVGFVAADGDRILGADVFGNHDLFERLAGHYLDSYLVDAFSDESPKDGEDLTPERARHFLQSLQASRAKESAGASEGREARFRASELFAYGLGHEGKTVHVSLFPVRGGASAIPERKKAEPPPSVDGGDDDEADGGSVKHDPTEQGRRIRERQEGLRRGAPAKPRPLDPPPGANRPGANPKPQPNPPSRSPKSDLR